MSLTNNRIDELRGSMLTVLPPTFVSLCTSSRYGGKLEVNDATRTEFTATEEKIIEVINHGISDVLEAQLRSNRTQTTQADSPMTKVDRSTYAAFSNKLSKGTPNQYWVERFIDKVRVHVIQRQIQQTHLKICTFITLKEYKT